MDTGPSQLSQWSNSVISGKQTSWQIGFSQFLYETCNQLFLRFFFLYVFLLGEIWTYSKHSFSVFFLSICFVFATWNHQLFSEIGPFCSWVALSSVVTSIQPWGLLPAVQLPTHSCIYLAITVLGLQFGHLSLWHIILWMTQGCRACFSQLFWSIFQKNKKKKYALEFLYQNLWEVGNVSLIVLLDHRTIWKKRFFFLLFLQLWMGTLVLCKSIQPDYFQSWK